MDATVFAAVLVAAVCHAGWNAVIKIGLEPFSAAALIAIAGGLVALPFLPIVGLPIAAAWPWLLASAVVHLAYFSGLAEAYRSGDMGQVYPVARGSAPLLTALASSVFVGEHLSARGWTGIFLLAFGVLILSLHGGRDLARFDRRAVGFALFTALTICLYTVTDGIGVRASGNASAYAAMSFVTNAIAMTCFALLRRGPRVFETMRPYWKSGVAGGALSLVAYWIVLWAMTVAPIAIVAALRETSVLFGAAVAMIVLKERLRATRALSAVMIVCGLALIRIYG